ncbi:MAG: DUF4870 domain-containing protein [Pseudomonadaceae bacterium]|nr:MAG: DUF4870 domain-containing protein [Pseudomonadaceae bacterium]
MTEESPQPVPPTGPDAEARKWALIAHLSGLIGFLIPFGSLIGPLLVWQLKKDADPFIDDQGKEALNFQITVAIAGLICVLLMVVLIGLLLIWVVIIGALVLMVIAAIKSNEGQAYRYPFIWRVIK